MSADYHGLAGRHIWGPPDTRDGENCVTWCTCGLSFFGAGRQIADEKWQDHAASNLAEDVVPVDPERR